MISTKRERRRRGGKLSQEVRAVTVARREVGQSATASSTHGAEEGKAQNATGPFAKKLGGSWRLPNAEEAHRSRRENNQSAKLILGICLPAWPQRQDVQMHRRRAFDPAQAICWATW